MESLFDDDVPEVGGEIEAQCPSCKGDTKHAIISLYENEIRRVQCLVCSQVHAFRKAASDFEEGEEAVPEEPPPVTPRRKINRKPTWEEAMAQAPQSDLSNCRPYSIRDTYEDLDIISHPSFGIGFVTELLPDNKVEVTFKDARRVMVHNRGDLAPRMPSIADIPAPRTGKRRKKRKPEEDGSVVDPATLRQAEAAKKAAVEQAAAVKRELTQKLAAQRIRSSRSSREEDDLYDEEIEELDEGTEAEFGADMDDEFADGFALGDEDDLSAAMDDEPPLEEEARGPGRPADKKSADKTSADKKGAGKKDAGKKETGKKDGGRGKAGARAARHANGVSVQAPAVAAAKAARSGKDSGGTAAVAVAGEKGRGKGKAAAQPEQPAGAVKRGAKKTVELTPPKGATRAAGATRAGASKSAGATKPAVQPAAKAGASRGATGTRPAAAAAKKSPAAPPARSAAKAGTKAGPARPSAPTKKAATKPAHAAPKAAARSAKGSKAR
jgi:hypothetical protein